jgi:predicted nuclease of restriction endonuclease-like RecB superfamily
MTKDERRVEHAVKRAGKFVAEAKRASKLAADLKAYRSRLDDTYKCDAELARGLLFEIGKLEQAALEARERARVTTKVASKLAWDFAMAGY